MIVHSEGGGSAWDVGLFDITHAQTKINFIAGADDDSADQPDMKVPKTLGESVWNYGLLPQDAFIDAVAHSKVLVGVGNPVL